MELLYGMSVELLYGKSGATGLLYRNSFVELHGTLSVLLESVELLYRKSVELLCD